MYEQPFVSYAEVATLDEPYRSFLEVGTDRAHWGNGQALEPVHDGQINISADYPEYSFAAKPFRKVDGSLEGTTIWPAKQGSLCVPPIRLVAENAWALLWLWNAFLEGKASQYGYGFDSTANMYSPLYFQRPHFFKNYIFNVRGSASPVNEGGQWVLSVDQSYAIERWSDQHGGWSPLSELTPYEPVVADVHGNMFRWQNSSSVVPGGATMPFGATEITCTFAIPLPLSVGYNPGWEYGNVAMFDTRWLSSSGYT